MIIRYLSIAVTLVGLIIFATMTGRGQTTEINYQGSLQDGATAANGNYDFEFRLYDALTGDVQIGPAVSRASTPVSNGSFSVTLDFGTAFTGADRFLEIRVRPTGGGGFTILEPRNRVRSSPHAIQSLNAANAANATNSANAANATNAVTAQNALQLNGVAASQYVVTTDPRMTNARTPTAGSPNYIQNQSTGAQTASNFNISGNGIAGGTISGNILNATTQVNVNSVRAFTINGLQTNPGFPLALSNTFAGVGAGINTVPDPNQGLGSGKENSFFGVYAGVANISGNSNSFFGSQAGYSNTTGSLNSFFGLRSGTSNIGGYRNSFFGGLAGLSNTSGGFNTFVGGNAGTGNTTGDNNTAVGYSSSLSADLQYATAIGSDSHATLSNSIYLGRPGGEDTVRIPGALSVSGNLVQASGGLAVFNSPVRLVSLSTGGETALCRRNADLFIATCGSSLRYKNNVNQFTLGLSLVNQLKPITFDWKDGGMHDLGLGAEDVAAIEPLLVTYNANGQVEGVKYDRIGVVLVNAVKEQQAEIESLRSQIAELSKLVCATNRSAAICQEKER